MDWMPEITKSNLRLLAVWWVGLLLVLFIIQWRSKRAAGLPLAFALNLSLMHLSGAFAYCFEYYQPRAVELVSMGSQIKYTYLGFWVALVSFGSFVLGSGLAQMVFKEKLVHHLQHPWPPVTSKLPGTLLIVASLFFLFAPILTKIPSFGSITVAGSNLAVLGVVLFCYLAYQAHNSKRFIIGLASTATFPVVTVLFLGFAGYGISAAIASWQMILRFFKPRLVGVVALAALCFGGLTVYVNYMRERGSIRDAVWGAQAASKRIEKALLMFENFEVFNPYDQAHLEIIDIRLNQNDLVGKSVDFISGNRVEFAYGGTIAAAAIAWIPRILWPGKPVIGGSGSLVSRYTGQKFADGTSVGVGLVLEMYINWGMKSVVIGFILYGLLLGFLDFRAASYLNRGDNWNFVRWALPALGFMQPGGVLTEAVGSAAACYVLVTFMHHQFFARYYLPIQPPSSRGSRGSKLN